MDVQDAIKNIKDQLPNVTPTPPGFHPQANAHELKSRLHWGEPGLTILDVRDHEAYRTCHITGAMNVSVEEAPAMAKATLPRDRDIYVYGNNDEQTGSAASVLREAGFGRVAELKGGLDAWKELDGEVEGLATNGPEVLGPDSYNVASRLQEHAEVQAKERAMEKGR